MNIGDKVRLLRAKEEGVVTRFLPGGQVEIEIEAGFRIPVMQSELVVVSPLEAERMRKPEPTQRPANWTPEPQRSGAARGDQRSGAPAILSNQGVYLAYVPQNDREVAVHLVNNTDWELAYTIGEEQAGGLRGLQTGVLRAKSHLKLNEQYAVARFEQWPPLLVQALWFRAGQHVGRPPLQKRLKPKAATFYKNGQNVPLLNQKGHLFQLDDEVAAPNVVGTAGAPAPGVPAAGVPAAVQPDALRAELLTPKSAAERIAVEPPAAVVDLHIEKLLPAGQPAPPNPLEVQLRAFERSLENAIASGMPDITFIHGVGSGTLRQELHRRLGRHPNVRFYEDAQKQKFGYGATKVTLK